MKHVVQNWVGWYSLMSGLDSPKKGNGLSCCIMTSNEWWYIHAISITSSKYIYLILILMTATSVNLIL